MPKEFTPEQFERWLSAQPKKMVTVKVVIVSDQGNVLLIKPEYKKTWQLPGGAIDAGEGAEVAALREVKEEVGITIPADDLEIVGTAYKKEHELLVLMYKCNTPVSEDTALTLEGEMTNYEFVSPDEVAGRLPDYYADFWKRYKASI